MRWQIFLEDSNVPSLEQQNKMRSMVALGKKSRWLWEGGEREAESSLWGVYGIVSHVYVSIPVNNGER